MWRGFIIAPRFHENKEEDKKFLTAIAKEKAIPLYQMIKHSKEYKLIKQVNTIF